MQHCLLEHLTWQSCRMCLRIATRSLRCSTSSSSSRFYSLAAAGSLSMRSFRRDSQERKQRKSGHFKNRRDVITNLLVWLSGVLERQSYCTTLLVFYPLLPGPLRVRPLQQLKSTLMRAGDGTPGRVNKKV